MNKSDLIEALKKEAGLTRAIATEVVTYDRRACC
jgi:nucleoid DNA-binding protein